MTTSPNLIAKIGIASCCKLEARKNQWAWRSIVEARPDLVLLLGDNVYAKNNGWDYSYLKAIYEEQNNIPDFQYFKENCSFIATWDDHDLGPDNAMGETEAAREIGVTGEERRVESKKLLMDFLRPNRISPKNLSPVKDEMYCSYKLKSIRVIVLDGRSFREPATKGPDAQIFGKAQESWLWEQLQIARDEQAVSTLVCCGSTINSNKGSSENISNYQNFYDRFSSEMQRCSNAVFLSGDIHQNRIRVHDGFLEVISSGVAQTRPRRAKSLKGGRKRLNNRAFLYIHDNHIRVTMHGSDKGNEVFDFPFSQKLHKKRYLNDRTWKNSDG